MDMPNEVILAKLGAAFHLHRKLAHSAARAAEAVDYLKEKGALEGLPAVPEAAAEKSKESNRSLDILSAATSGVTIGDLAASVTSVPLVRYLTPKLKTRDMTEQELSALRKNMGVPSSVRVEKIPWERCRVGPHYDFQTHTVYTDNPRSYSTAHEFGHASGPFTTFRRLRGPYMKGYRMGISSLSGLMAGMNAANQEQLLLDNEEGGVGSKILSGLDMASKAGTGVMLAEEGQATARALRAIHKIQGKAGLLRGAKIFLPAYATYLAKALGHHFIAPSVAKWAIQPLPEDE